MIANLAWLGLIAFGHLCLIVFVINSTHGSGLSEKGMRRVELATLLYMAVSSLALVVYAVTRPVAAWPWPWLAYAGACLTAASTFVATTVARALRAWAPGQRCRRREVFRASAGDRLRRTGTGHRSGWMKIPGNEALDIAVSEWDVEIDRLPAELDGLSILHLSDLHFSTAYDRRYFEAVADLAAREEADFVFFTGDLIDSPESIDWIRPLLSRLRGNFGQLAILGNHDFDQDFRRIYREVLGSGFRVIEGRWAEVEMRGMKVAIGGTSAPWGRHLRWEQTEGDDLRILLSHTPDLFPQASRRGIDLMLSGHNHGGQVRLPGIGPVLVPSLYGRRFDRGFFRRGGMTLHVSPGIGAKHPLRFRCPPEIVRLTLRSKAATVEKEEASEREPLSFTSASA